MAEKAVASTVEQRVYETVKKHIKFSLLVRHLKEMNPYMAAFSAILVKVPMNWRDVCRRKRILLSMKFMEI